MKHLRVLNIGLVSLLVALSANNYAEKINGPPVQDTPDQATVEASQDVMRKLNTHLKALYEFMHGRLKPSPSDQELLEHARFLQALAAKIPGLFPKGSAGDETATRSEIWERRGEFERIAEQLQQQITTFLQALETGNEAQIQSAYRELDLNRACAACHTVFRKQAAGERPTGSGSPPKTQ